jgi:predicted DNA binding CopG/RHH family protein
MVRPCTIEPHGEVTSLKVRVSAKQKRELEKKAEKRGLTVGALVREILEKAS